MTEYEPFDNNHSDPFLQDSPLNLFIEDADSNGSHLYIDPSDDLHEFICEIRSQTDSLLRLISAGAHETIETQYHFALYFRPGTFPANTFETDVKVIEFPEDQKWEFKVAKEVKRSESEPLQVIYFLYVGPSGLIKSHENLKFTIQYLSVNVPARATRVQLKYQNLEQGDGQSSRFVHGNSLNKILITDFTR